MRLSKYREKNINYTCIHLIQVTVIKVKAAMKQKKIQQLKKATCIHCYDYQVYIFLCSLYRKTYFFFPSLYTFQPLLKQPLSNYIDFIIYLFILLLHVGKTVFQGCNYKCISLFLKEHKRRHQHRKDTLVCDVCGMTFKSQTGLRYHSFSHEEEDMRHNCKICDKVFGWKNQLMVKKKK